MEKHSQIAERRLLEELMKDYEAYRKSKDFHKYMPRVALQMHLVHLGEKGLNQSKIAKAIRISRSDLNKFLADKNYSVSCKIIVKLSILFKLELEVAEAWLRGFGFELDCRIPTYQFYRLLIKICSKIDDELSRDKYIKIAHEIKAARDVKKHEEEWVRRLCAEAIEHAKEHNLRTFIRVHKAKSGVKDDHYERDETWEPRLQDPEIIIRCGTLEKCAEDLNLLGEDKHKLFQIAGRYISAK